jgi:hypothetical protein
MKGFWFIKFIGWFLLIFYNNPIGCDNCSISLSESSSSSYFLSSSYLILWIYYISYYFCCFYGYNDYPFYFSFGSSCAYDYIFYWGTTAIYWIFDATFAFFLPAFSLTPPLLIYLIYLIFFSIFFYYLFSFTISFAG